MEFLIVEEILKKHDKDEIFIMLIKKMFKDNNINEEKGIEILRTIYN